MAMVNMNNLLNGKDPRWLQLEVCREFQRNKCTRPDTECKFAHPPANVEVQNGRVTACYDSIKLLIATITQRVVETDWKRTLDKFVLSQKRSSLEREREKRCVKIGNPFAFNSLTESLLTTCSRYMRSYD
ncbi:Protein muscleblind [Anthophora plagiata]